MKQLFVNSAFVLLIATLAACTSSSRSTIANPINASADPVAKVEAVTDGLSQDDIGKNYALITADCDESFKSSPTSGLHKGSTQMFKSDSAYTDGYGKRHGDSQEETVVVEKIEDANNFITLVNSNAGHYSVLSRFKNLLNGDSSYSHMTEIISSSPPFIKDAIQKDIGRRTEDSYSNCHGDLFGADSAELSEVDVTLKDGSKYRAIMRTERSNYRDYVCTQIRKTDKAEIAKTKVADYTQQVSVTVVAEGFVNPFKACHSRHKILDSYGVFAAQANKDGEYVAIRTPISLHKTEVLKIK